MAMVQFPILPLQIAQCPLLCCCFSAQSFYYLASHGCYLPLARISFNRDHYPVVADMIPRGWFIKVIEHAALDILHG